MIPINYWVRRTSLLARSCRSWDRERAFGRVCVVLVDRVDDADTPKWLPRSRLTINIHQVTISATAIFPVCSNLCVVRRLIAKGLGTASAAAEASANRVGYATPMANALHARVSRSSRSRTSR